MFVFWFVIIAISLGHPFWVTAAPPDAPDQARSRAADPTLIGQIKLDGISFMRTLPWPIEDNGQWECRFSPLQAESLYLLGCMNSIDEPNPGWGGGDSRRNFFIGDSIGSFGLRYASGRLDTIPLVYGYTVWWRGCYQKGHEPLTSDPKMISLLDRALCVANGAQGYRPNAKDYFIRIQLRPEPLAAIILTDNADKDGHPIFEGITFEGAERVGAHDGKLFLHRALAEPDATLKPWLKAHAIESANPYPRERAKAVGALGRALCTRAEDIDERVIRGVAPQSDPIQAAGPRVIFQGPAEALLMTRIFHDNLNEMLARVDADGMVHESAKDAPNFLAFGTYAPALAPFYQTSYTRIRALTLLSEMGFFGQADKAIDYFDRWAMYFPQAYPAVQLGGKPVPAHAAVVANWPHFYFDSLPRNIWPTRFKTRDMGNPEIDGHGMLMLTHWRTWRHQGRPKSWVEQRWEPMRAMADFIPWALDHPELSLSQHGLLYSESEGGLGIESFYANYPCYLGLLAYAQMAEAIGQAEKATYWHAQAERLFKNMEAYFPASLEPWGDVWDPKKTASWGGYDQGGLAPLLFGMDYWGFDVAERLPKGWLDRTQRSYAMMLRNMKPEWCAPAGLGYGQCYFAQGALLLDRMGEATRMVNWLARMCFAPRLPKPYIVPEGVTIATDQTQWRRYGDLGNLYQMAEVIYTLYVVLGIDDADGRELKLLPRLPLGWSGLEVKNWPIQVQAAEGPAPCSLAMKMHWQEAGKSLKLRVSLDRPVNRLSIRLGPFGAGSKAIEVSVNGQSTPCRLIARGDAVWGWIELAASSRLRDFDIRGMVVR